MTKEVAHMLVIDRCPDCKGVWLDGGELDRIKDGVESNAVLLMARGMSGPF
jgi:Zn-finger nucleic acid-binding protein